MRLADLRVDPVQYCDHAKGLCAGTDNSRPATVSDLVAALIEQGAMLHSSNNAIEIGWFNGDTRRYLVFRIPEEVADV